MASPFNHDAKLMEWEHSGAEQCLAQGAVKQRNWAQLGRIIEGKAASAYWRELGIPTSCEHIKLCSLVHYGMSYPDSDKQGFRKSIHKSTAAAVSRGVVNVEIVKPHDDDEI